MNLKNSLVDDFIIVPTALIKDKVISFKAQILAIEILALGNSRNFNKTKLADALNFSVPTLDKYLKELELRGWISLVKDKKQDSYTFNVFPELVQAPRPEPKKIELGPIASTLLKECIDIYHNFYLKIVEVKPYIDGDGVNALKKMIDYFRGLKGDDRVKEAFITMFDNWGLVDPFYQDQLKLTQINSNLPNILNNIKNGISRAKQTGGVTGNRESYTDRLGKI